jgi:hypothetical protein
MKSFKDISWQVTEEEYRADPAYSYSTLSRFNREGFNNLSKLFDRIETPSLTFGSMVDTLITDGQEEFDRRFLVADFPDLSDKLINITKTLFDLYKDQYNSINDIPDDMIASIGAENNYYADPKFKDYRVKLIKKNCNEYYELLYLATNKTLVTSNFYMNALLCADTLKTHSNTKECFSFDPFNKDVEYLYQLKFKGEYEGIPIRCMADLIKIDHKNKVVTPYDLKTSSKKEWDFYKSFIEWGYFIQAQLYWYIIRQNMDKDPIFKDYTLTNYHFIVINNISLTPLIWEYPDTQVITDCVYGKNNQYKCRNWRNIVKELHYYLTSNSEYPIGIKPINNLKTWLNEY